MLPNNRIPTHPGEVLAKEFLEPLGISPGDLARRLGVTESTVQEILDQRRGVAPEMAWLLAGAFGTTPEFWSNLEMRRELALTRPEKAVEPFTVAS